MNDLVLLRNGAEARVPETAIDGARARLAAHISSHPAPVTRVHSLTGSRAMVSPARRRRTIALLAAALVAIVVATFWLLSEGLPRDETLPAEERLTPRVEALDVKSYWPMHTTAATAGDTTLLGGRRLRRRY